MSNRSIACVLLLFILPLIGCSKERPPSGDNAQISKPTIDQCAALWRSMPDVDRAGIEIPAASLLTQWEKVGAPCKGTGVYELHMASIYLADGNAPAAKKVLRSITATSEEYRTQIELLLFESDLQIEIASRTDLAVVLDKFESRLLELSRKYERNCSVMAAVADFNLYVERFSEALRDAEAAALCDPDDWRTRKLAVFSAWKAQAYDRIRPHCAAGVEINKALMSNPGFMLACAAGDVPPVLSSAAIWSPIPNNKEIGREEAFYRRTDHRLPA